MKEYTGRCEQGDAGVPQTIFYSWEKPQASHLGRCEPKSYSAVAEFSPSEWGEACSPLPGWGPGTVAERLPGKCNVLNLMPTTANKQQAVATSD